jgi:hypothetical protein
MRQSSLSDHDGTRSGTDCIALFQVRSKQQKGLGQRVTTRKRAAIMAMMRWKRRLILVLVALITFSSVPLPNIVIWRPDSPSAREGHCRVLAKIVQIALSASTNPAPFEARVWEPARQRCGEWRSYVGG